MSDFQGGDILASEMSFSTWSILDELQINFIYPDSYNEKLQFIAIPIGENLNKEMWPTEPFGHARAPLGIRHVIHLLVHRGRG